MMRLKDQDLDLTNARIECEQSEAVKAYCANVESLLAPYYEDAHECIRKSFACEDNREASRYWHGRHMSRLEEIERQRAILMRPVVDYYATRSFRMVIPAPFVPDTAKRP